MTQDDIDLEIFKKFDMKVFLSAVAKAKKIAPVAEEDEFLEGLSSHLAEKHGMSDEDAQKYSEIVLQIWEEKAFASLTAFDQEMTDLRKSLF